MQLFGGVLFSSELQKKKKKKKKKKSQIMQISSKTKYNCLAAYYFRLNDRKPAENADIIQKKIHLFGGVFLFSSE